MSLSSIATAIGPKGPSSNPQKSNDIKYLSEDVERVVKSGLSIIERPSSVSQDFPVGVTGLNSERKPEAVCMYKSAPADKIYSNDNNSWAVFGRDRNKSLASGYGGAGHPGAGAIDLVTGRMSAVGPRDGLYADPSFQADAARIYISQKADIDDYFDLTAGNVGISSERSAVAIKADSVRLASRMGMKLVTGTDPTNSTGGWLLSTKGIDLIAGNDDSDLQPIPKGNNVADALRQLKKNIDNLNGIVNSFITHQMSFNLATQAHVHPIAQVPSVDLNVAGCLTAANLISQCVVPVYVNKINLLGFDMNYCQPFGSKWICGYNRTT